MKKKIKDLTNKEMKTICDKNNCSKNYCPLQSRLIEGCWFDLLEQIKEEMNKEIDL